MAASLADITIVIPYYSGKQSLNTLLNYLVSLSVIVVNNSASKVDSRLSKKNVQVIDMPFNSGFAHACNVGALAATTPWILFLNPDVEISESAIETLLAEVQDRSLQALSPRLVDANNHLLVEYHQSLPTALSLFSQFSPLHRLYKSVPDISKTGATTLPGACLLISKTALNTVDYWDERFFVWWEDSDLSQKLKQAGLHFGISKSIKVKHIGGESFSSMPDAWKRSIFFHSLSIYIEKHLSGITEKLLRGTIQRFHSGKLYSQDNQLDLSIVVPNLKHELLKSFLDTNYTFLNKSHIELIIVTSSASVKALRKQYPFVIFITLQQNKGFATTVNIGLKRARGKIIGTINDDVVLHENWETQLLKAFHPKVGSVVPKVTTPAGETESIGVHVLKKGKAYVITKADDISHPANAFNAACVLFSREALETVGLFYEPFGSYLEDLDLGLRLGRHNFMHVAVPTVSVVHVGQQTSKDNSVHKAWLDTKNWWLLLLRNHSLMDWLLNLPSILVERAKNISGLFKAGFKKS